MKIQLSILCFLSIPLLSGCVTTKTLSSKQFNKPVTIEHRYANYSEPVYGKREVPLQIVLPEGDGPFPVIVTQHGSNRDGLHFEGGDGVTDEYSSRLILKAVDKGFAVIALDAFHQKNLASNDKLRQPIAYNYAVSIIDRLRDDTRFDRSNLFYTGFSFGARNVLNSLSLPYSTRMNWRALVAAEPDCNTFHAPPAAGIPPTLIIKGGESHYGPIACQKMVAFYQKAGVHLDFKLFPKSNHFFSHNGQPGTGIAFNGCEKNPVVIFPNSIYQHVDGAKTSAAEVRKKCFTTRVVSGETREDLDEVVDTVISYFSERRSK